MRLSRKEEKERAARREDRLRRTASGGSSLSSKYRRSLKRTQPEENEIPSSGSSPRSEASYDSTYLRSGLYKKSPQFINLTLGNFDEIRAEFSRSKRRRLDAYRLIQKLKSDENFLMKNDLRELAKGLYDADISMLDIRISQLEKENNKLKLVKPFFPCRIDSKVRLLYSSCLCQKSDGS